MLQDRLVVGIRDVAMLQKLQMDAELTLEKTKKKAFARMRPYTNNSVSCKDTAVHKTP